MPSSIKQVIGRINAMQLCLTVVGLACCLISLGTFDGSISSFTDADFFGVRIGVDPLSGGLPIIVSCLLVSLVCCRKHTVLRASWPLCIGLAMLGVVGLALLFLGAAGMVSCWLSEFGGALLTLASIVTFALWAQCLSDKGIEFTLLSLGLAFALETIMDLLIENALVDIAGMVVLAVVVAASPILVSLLSNMPAVPIVAEEDAAACRPERAQAPSSTLTFPFSLMCIFVWGFLMGRVQGMGNEAENSSLLVLFITSNAVGLSALAVAALCLSAARLRFAFSAMRIVILATLVCSLYFSGTFGPVSIPVGMFTMGLARMAVFAYIWMLVCDVTAQSEDKLTCGNNPAFIAVVGWGVFTFANTLSTKLGLLIPAGGVAFLVYNILIMACLAALILVEFLPKKTGGTDAAGQILPTGEATSSQISEELLVARCAQFADRYGLTEREREVLVPLVRGRSASNIAARLSMSTETARAHIRHIYQKTDIHSREELMDIVDGM